MHELPVPVTDKAKDVPAGLAEITMKLLEKQPEARYQRGHDVADALYEWIGAQGLVEMPPVRASRPLGVG